MVLIPQSLAYADLAGLQAVHGLYAAAAAPLAAALIGSSPYLQTGPVALTSLLTFGALAPLAEAGTASFGQYAALLALLVGVVRAGIGLLGWGAVAYLMSLPVVTGFTVAAALLIICSQVPGLVSVEAEPASPLLAAAEAISQPGQWSLAALAIGAATIAVLALGRRISAVFPWALVVTAGGLAVTGFGLVQVAEVGTIPSGLPIPNLALPWSALPDLAVPALVIGVVGFAEPASIARRYARADRLPWDPDREFLGQGLANLGAGLAGGLPSGGSFSRSALNRISGARTRWSGAITGTTVLLFLPVADVLSGLPTAVLAGLVIVAAVSLLDLTPFREYWQQSRPQFLVAVPTFVVTLAAAPRVERGLLLGVGLALVVHLWREARVEVDGWRDGETLHVRPHGVLYFASAPAVEVRIRELLENNTDADRLSIDLHRLGRLDLTGLYVLRDIAEHMRVTGMAVEFRGVPPHAADRARVVLGAQRLIHDESDDAHEVPDPGGPDPGDPGTRRSDPDDPPR